MNNLTELAIDFYVFQFNGGQNNDRRYLNNLSKLK